MRPRTPAPRGDEPRRVGTSGASRGATAGVWIPVLIVAALLAPIARAAPVAPAAIRAQVVPSTAHIGERVMYQGRVVFQGPADAVRWLTPEPDSDLTWGSPVVRRGRAAGTDRGDTLYVEIPLQAFRTGTLTIPGLRFQRQDPASPALWRLPVTRLTVTSVLTPADSNADLRPLRGPIEAPWWERVPWGWVILGLVALALAVLAFWAWRRRRRAPAPAAPAEDPASAALRRLEELRVLSLPESGRFADHAFELTSILRRYLEATASSARPGDTTSELTRRFEHLPLSAEERQQLGELLRLWDRIKFAREPFTVTGAHAAERDVETFLRRRSKPPREKAA
jgi:uncharacterized protein DUF4381